MRISSKCRRFGPLCPLNPFRRGQRVHILKVKVQVAGVRAKRAPVRQSAEGIFLRNVRQGERAVDELADAIRRQIAGAGGCGSLPDKNPQAQCARSRLHELLHFAHAHGNGELVALARHGLGVARARLHRHRHHVCRQRLEICVFDFLPIHFNCHDLKLPKPAPLLFRRDYGAEVF